MPGRIDHHNYLIDGITYHTLDSGTGDPIVLLHGFTGRAENWQTVTAHLHDHRRVIAVDLLGHGKTDSPTDPARYAIDHAASDLIALLDQLDMERVDLLGYSMGGRLALFTALRHPDRFRSLILESSSPGIVDPVERERRSADDHALADRIERDGIRAFVDHWENLPLFASQKRLPPALQAQVRTARLGSTPKGLANSLRGMGTGQQPSLWADLPRLNLATLLIVGELDTKYVEIGRKMMKELPSARIITIEDAGHTTHLEKPDSFCQAVNHFLDARP